MASLVIPSPNRCRITVEAPCLAVLFQDRREGQTRTCWRRAERKKEEEKRKEKKSKSTWHSSGCLFVSSRSNYIPPSIIVWLGWVVS